jgi:hypothetical protein
MKNAIKGALLSGLVFPGLGQLALKRYLRGIVFFLVAVACVAVIVNTTVNEVMAGLNLSDPAALAGPNALSDLARQTAGSGGEDGSGLALFAFGVCWVLGVIDAFLIGRRMDRQAR